MSGYGTSYDIRDIDRENVVLHIAANSNGIKATEILCGAKAEQVAGSPVIGLALAVEELQLTHGCWECLDAVEDLDLTPTIADELADPVKMAQRLKDETPDWVVDVETFRSDMDLIVEHLNDGNQALAERVAEDAGVTGWFPWGYDPETGRPIDLEV